MKKYVLDAHRASTADFIAKAVVVTVSLAIGFGIGLILGGIVINQLIGKV